MMQSKSRVVRGLLYALGSLSIIAIFFFGTLLLLNSYDAAQRDALRAEHAAMLKRALDRYHATRGVFPPGRLADNPVDDLAPQLLGGSYLRAIPRDPLPERSYRYTTDGADDGQRYGLKIPLERTGDCLTGIGTEGRGWWGTLPPCPF